LSTPNIESCVQFIQEALECAVYIRPEAPGLSSDELLAVAATKGYKAGTVNDAVDRLVKSGQIDWDGPRLEFGRQTQGQFADFMFPLEPEYRNFKAFDAIFGQLRDLADEQGIAMAMAAQDELIEHGISLGINQHDMAVAFAVLRLAGLLTQTKDDNNKWRLAPYTQATPLLPSEQNAQLRSKGNMTRRRPRLPALYEAVKGAIGVSIKDSPSVQLLVTTPKLNASPKVMPDKKKVFIIHGRNEVVQKEMADFIRSMGPALSRSLACRSIRSISHFVRSLLW